MPTLKYESVYDRALSRVKDTELFQLVEDDFYNYMKNWLKAAIALPQFRKQFSSFKTDDEIMVLNFSLRNPVDEEYDKEFVTNILSEGLIVNYLPSKIDTGVNMAVMIGGKEEKKLIDNYGKMQDRLHDLEVKLGRELSQHGYYFGGYGE